MSRLRRIGRAARNPLATMALGCRRLRLRWLGVEFGPFSYITDVNHGTAAGSLIRLQPYESRPVHIGSDVWFGVGVTVLPGVTVGDGAVLGARAVVTKDVPAGAIAVGSPARIIRYRKSACHEPAGQ